MYENYQGYRGIDEEGENWFIGWEPYVFDASIYDMILLQDNVIIMAELDFVSEWAEPVPDENEPAVTPEPAGSQFNTMTLKDYVLNNAEYLKDYVLEKILGY